MAYKRPAFWIALSIIITTAIIVSIIYLRIARLPFITINILGAVHSLTHWFGYAGIAIILVGTVSHSLLKRTRGRPSGSLLRLHAFGNLIGFLLVSVHFTQQVTRPAANYPELGTGIVLYASTLILVTTGFSTYFVLKPSWLRYYKFLHPAAAFTLLMVIIMHIIHGI